MQSSRVCQGRLCAELMSGADAGAVVLTWASPKIGRDVNSALLQRPASGATAPLGDHSITTTRLKSPCCSPSLERAA